MAKNPAWDTELYEAQHSFVWKMGEDLIKTLSPQAGERILDLGCGTGHLTAAIAMQGASVLGLDSSPDMIGQARQNFPRLQFVLQSAASMNFAGEFDAIFSNASLHWMQEPRVVGTKMAEALRSGGRLVAEFGGKGNIGTIEHAIRSAISHAGAAVIASPWYFPALGEYASLLETIGFEVRFAVLFDRPTPLTGERGMEQWLSQFAAPYFNSLDSKLKVRVRDEVISTLRATLWNGEAWLADYRRLRIVAVRL